MSSLTAANTIITISQPILFPQPQQLQGFGSNDVTDMPAVKILEHLMGVDGKLSFGFVFVERPQEITLMADSASNGVFDTINNAQQAAADVYQLNGTIIFKGLGLKYICVNGGLEMYKPLAQAQKIYNPRKFSIVWESVTPVQFSG